MMAAARPPADLPTSARWEKGMRIFLPVLRDDIHGIIPPPRSYLTLETPRWAIHPYGPAYSDEFPWRTVT